MWNGFMSVINAIRWLFGEDIPAPASGGTEGTGIFIALATFALAEGGALTAVAKGEGRDSIVLAIYGVIVVFTIGWIVFLLRFTAEDRTSSATRRIRAFDALTHRYGQVTLIWTFLLALIMFFLALNQLLPN